MSAFTVDIENGSVTILVIFLGTGDGGVLPHPRLFDVPDYTWGIVPGSFNGDQTTDLALVSSVGVALYLTTP